MRLRPFGRNQFSELDLLAGTRTATFARLDSRAAVSTLAAATCGAFACLALRAGAVIAALAVLAALAWFALAVSGTFFSFSTHGELASCWFSTTE
jgi:hypothetical protein